LIRRGDGAAWHGARRAPCHGFTLIELVVAMAVAAILATIAISSYSSYVVRSKRAAARTALLQDAQYLERNYTVAGCYTNVAPGCTGAASAVPIVQAPQEGAAAYTITAAIPGPGTSAYLLTATPNLGGFTDPVCGSLTLDNTGAKNATGTDPSPIVDCWQR